MSSSTRLLRNLRFNLTSVLAGTHVPRQLDEVILLCHSLALSAISGKLSAGKINPHFLGLKDSDLAYDCIADLFQRDDGGAVLQLKAYFESFSIDNASDELLLAQLRRLIFARVNQGLFRIYNEADPALGKILRNIKLAILSLQNFVETEKFGETYVMPSLCDPLFELREIDQESFERLLRNVCKGNERIPEILAKLCSSLRRQEECSRAVRLMSVAYAIRSLYGETQKIDEQGPVVEQALFADDTISIIHDSCLEVKAKNHSKYVGKKKVTLRHYESYFLVIEGKLKEIFVSHDGEEYSLFDQLKTFLPTITKEQYKREHKNILEYLSRLAHDRAVERLKKE